MRIPLYANRRGRHRARLHNGTICSGLRAVLCGGDLLHCYHAGIVPPSPACAVCMPQAILFAHTHTIMIVIQSFAYLFLLVII